MTIACIPVQPDGTVDPRWGRADRVAVADVRDGTIAAWDVVDVGWSVLHDTGGEGSHHARVVRFLLDRGIEAVVANHMGGGMVHTLGKMNIPIHLGASGDARDAVLAALATAT